MSTTKAHFELIMESDSVPENTLVLMGTALDGPAHVPFRINPNYNVYEVLGNTPLARAYTLARNAGASQITFYRLNGIYAAATIKDYTNGASTPILSLTSVSASDPYNEIELQINNDQDDINVNPTFLQVTASDGQTVRKYSFRDYPRALDLANAINRDADYGFLEFSASAVLPSFEMTRMAHATEFFTGGDAEASLIPDRKNTADITGILTSLRNRVKEALFGVDLIDQQNFDPNSILSTIDFGVIALVDMFHNDDIERNYAFEDAGFSKLLGSFCLNKATATGFGTIGVIGITPLYDVSDQSVRKLTETLIRDYSPTLSSGGGGVVTLDPLTGTYTDWRSHIQVVVGDTYLTMFGIESYIESLAYAYAGSQVSLPYYNSMTNKTLYGVSQLTYNLQIPYVLEDTSKMIVDSLLAKGYISIIESIRKGTVPYASVTHDTKTSFSSPTAVRILHNIVKVLTESLDSFIGEAGNRLTNTGVLSKATDALAEMVDTGVLRSFDVGVRPMKNNAELHLDVEYTPFSEVRTVHSVIRLPFGQGVM